MTQVSKYPLGGTRCCSRLEKRLSAAFFRALSDPNRLALLCQLSGCGRPCTVSELSRCCTVDLSVVSRHLAALRDAGLIEATKRGREVRYAVRYRFVIDTLRSVADAVESCCRERDMLLRPLQRSAHEDSR